MERISITTKGGDKGKTGLFGGKRVSKASSRLHAYGTVDELNAVLGVILSEDSVPSSLKEQLLTVQRALFTVGADLATPVDSSADVPRITTHETEKIETWIHGLEDALPPLQRFILPSGSRLGSYLHLARTVCRRAERFTVALSQEETINTEVIVYLNRLSDYLFVAARDANRRAGSTEMEV